MNNLQVDQILQRQKAKLKKLLSEPIVFEHQRSAASITFKALDSGVRAVILAAEMQAGKSGVALAIACYQRMSLNDDQLVTAADLKDTLYIMTMADKQLLAQAKDDLKPATNVVVSNLIHFLNEIEKYFKKNDPKLLIVDECHYGSGDTSVRYEALFDYLVKENSNCKVVFISATPLSALLATEGDSLINRNIETKLVFHRTSPEYTGVREMLKKGQVINLGKAEKSILSFSSQREQFISHFNKCSSVGWSLVRVPSGTAMAAKRLLAKHCISESNIFILGNKLTGVPEDEHTSIDDFKDQYQTSTEFGEKVIAITVAGCRAGINFGQGMKENLISTWDSTVSNVAAVVQANIGRACGYHTNTNSLHFTNLDAVNAYGDVLSYLETNCSRYASSNIDGLRSKYEKICKTYDIKGFDVGASINGSGEAKARKKLNDAQTYMIDSYFAIPAKLNEPNFDFTKFTRDSNVLSAINAIRNVYLKISPIESKASRSLRGFSWIKAHWVNGDTYDNTEKAMASGTMFERALKLTNAFNLNEPVEFNDAVVPGGNEKTSDKLVAVQIFSVYNRSRRNIEKKCMILSDVHDVCDWFKCERDDTMLLIYTRGSLCPIRSSQKEKHANKQINKGSIIEGNHFLSDENINA